MLAWLIERARDDSKTFDNEKTINTSDRYAFVRSLTIPKRTRIQLHDSASLAAFSPPLFLFNTATPSTCPVCGKKSKPLKLSIS